MFCHGSGHKFFFVFILLLYLLPAPSLQAWVASQPSARETMRFYNKMYDLKEGIEVIDEEVSDKDFASLSAEEKDKSLSGL